MSIEQLRTLRSAIQAGDHPDLQGAWTPLLQS